LILIWPTVYGSQMNTREDIKTLFSEIEVYRSHSLFEEAREKCQKLERLIAENDRIKNKQELLNVVEKKIRELEADARRVVNEAASAQMSNKEQALVKKLFAVPKKGGDDAAAMEGAAALLVFGQFQKALSEFNPLIKKEALRVAAAKNIIRCHVGLSSLDEAVEQYERWLAEGRFPKDEIETIHSFLQDILKKKGVDRILSKPKQAPVVKEKILSKPEQAPAFEKKIFAGSNQAPAVVVKIRPKPQVAAAAVATPPPEPEKPVPVSGPALPKQEKLPDGDFIDILNIQLPLKDKSEDRKTIQLDVGYQKGNLVSVIIPRESQVLVEKFKAGLRIDGAELYSSSIVFSSSCVISDIKQIDTGPRKGGYALLLKILSS